MTMHEALFFIDGLHRAMVAGLQDKKSAGAPWLWPTRDLLAENLRANAAKFTGNRNQRSVGADFRYFLAQAKRRGWAVEDRCSPHCHAMHVWLTGTGMATLNLMNERGCSPQCATRPCVVSGLHLHRKAA